MVTKIVFFCIHYYSKKLSSADLRCEMCSFESIWRRCEAQNCKINVLRGSH